jgi:hypothetical protein
VEPVTESRAVFEAMVSQVETRAEVPRPVALTLVMHFALLELYTTVGYQTLRSHLRELQAELDFLQTIEAFQQDLRETSEEYQREFGCQATPHGTLIFPRIPRDDD